MGERHEVRIELAQNGTGTVLVDGHDLTRVTRAIRMDSEVGQPPKVHLELVPEAVALDLDGTDVWGLINPDLRIAAQAQVEQAFEDEEFRAQFREQLEGILESLDQMDAFAEMAAGTAGEE